MKSRNDAGYLHRSVYFRILLHFIENNHIIMVMKSGWLQLMNIIYLIGIWLLLQDRPAHYPISTNGNNVQIT